MVSEPLLPVPGAEEVALPQWLPAVQRALGHYASQLTVDGAEVVHVGGQRQPIVTTVWLTGPLTSADVRSPRFAQARPCAGSRRRAAGYYVEGHADS